MLDKARPVASQAHTSNPAEGFGSPFWSRQRRRSRLMKMPEMACTEHRPKAPCLASILAAWPPPGSQRPSSLKSPPEGDSRELLLESSTMSGAGGARGVRGVRGQEMEDSPSNSPWRPSPKARAYAQSSASNIEPEMLGMQELVHVRGLRSDQPVQSHGQLSGKGEGKILPEPAASGKFEGKAVISCMLGNLPYRATKRDISNAVDDMGFQGAYHICHMPSPNRRKARATNLGYAFICFADASSALAFMEALDSLKFPGASERHCTLTLAHLPCRHVRKLTLKPDS